MTTRLPDQRGVAHLASGLEPDEHGIWTDGVSRSLSYPGTGNRECSEVEDASFWFRHRNDCIVSLIKRHPPEGPILDVGGGNGYVTRRLLDEGLDAVLLEPGPEGARIAKTGRGIPEVLCTTLGDAGFPDGSLAAIGCFDVIEHIEDDQMFIRLIARLLRPGGLLYATTPAHRWLWSASDTRAGHYRRYDRERVSRLVGRDLALSDFTYLFGPLIVPILFFRTIPFVLGISRTRRVLPREVEHGVAGGSGARALNRLLARERDSIACGGRRRLGSSCLFVARKPV